MAAEREELTALRQEYENELQTKRADLSAKAAELDRLRRELSEVPPPAAPPAVDAEEVRQQLDALEAQRAQLQADRQRLERQQEAWEEDRTQSARHVEEQQQQLAHERETLAAEQEAIRAQQQAAAERAAEPPAEDLEAGDQGRQHPVEHDWATEQEPAPVETGWADEAEFPSASALSLSETVVDDLEETVRMRTAAGDDEDSMDVHIAAFMQRVRAHQLSATQPVEPKAKTRQTKNPPPPAAAQGPSESPSAEPSPPAADNEPRLQELLRRPKLSLAPDLNAKMRELAIGQAHSAIDTHCQQQSLRHAYGTLVTSAVCLASAFFVLGFADTTALRAGGSVLLVVGILWVLWSVRAANRVMASLRRKKAGGLRAIINEVDAELAALEKEKAQTGVAEPQ